MRSSATGFVGKRTDPNYMMINGLVPRKLGRWFKQVCVAKEIELSEGVEQALQLWLDLEADPQGKFKPEEEK